MDGTVLPNSGSTNFQNVNIKKSTNVHLGNRTYYKGPITIQQFLGGESSPGNTRVVQVKREKDLGKNSGSDSTQNVKKPSESTLPRIKEWIGTRRCIAIVCCILVPVIILSVWLAGISHGEVSTATESYTTFTTPTEPWTKPTTSTESLATSTTRTESPTASSTELITLLTSSTPPIESTTGTDEEGLVTREEWNAAEPKSHHRKLENQPVTHVIITQSSTEICLTKADCIATVHRIQDYVMELPIYIDIADNFLIGGDGLVYEGRGWDVVGQHTMNHNDISIGISFIGNFTTAKPTQSQLSATRKLIDYGVERKKLTKDFKLKGQRQVNILSRNPGDNLYNIIKQWDNWDCKGVKNDECKTYSLNL